MGSNAVTINGRDGAADFVLSSNALSTNLGSLAGSYKCYLDMMRVREVIEMTVADTFCIEGTADQEPGRSQLVGEIAGIGKKGDAQSGPLIPAPQNVGLVMTFSSSCTLSLTINFTEFYVDRLVNQNCRIGGRFLSKGTYVLSWLRS